MSDVSGRTVAALIEVDEQLLEVKLSVPRHRPGSVSRAALIEKGRTSGRRVVGVTAPAGYGKSTFLAQWAEEEERRVAWVSLDRFDDDPGALLSVLASAYARISDRSDIAADVGGVGISARGRAAPRLASALKSSPVPFVMMLDDLQEIQSPTCHDVLGIVISGIPSGSQLVAVSRSEQAHVPRLPASRVRRCCPKVIHRPGSIPLDPAGRNPCAFQHGGAGCRGGGFSTGRRRRSGRPRRSRPRARGFGVAGRGGR